jgi:RNA polymerase sigma factor FliA
VLKGGAAASERANAYMGNLSDRGGGGASVEDDVREISNAVTGLAMVFATSLEGSEGLQVSDDQIPADERIQLEQMRRRVRAAIEKLPEKERKLLQGYYFQNKTLEEAGAEIGQSKSWASRLHARAVETLKQLLEDEDDNPSEQQRRIDHGGTTGRNLSGTDRSAEAPRSGRPAGH